MRWTRTWINQSSPAASSTVCCYLRVSIPYFDCLLSTVILGELIAKRTPAVLPSESAPVVEDTPAQEADVNVAPADVSEPAAAPDSNGAEAVQTPPDAPTDTPIADPTDAPAADAPTDAPVEAGAEENTEAAPEQAAEE